MFCITGQMVLSNLVQKVGVCKCYIAHIISSGFIVSGRCQNRPDCLYGSMIKYLKKLHVQVFLRMNTWLFETCWRLHNCIKSLMKIVCILLVLISYMYHNAWFKRCKVYMKELIKWMSIVQLCICYFFLNIFPSMHSLPMGSFFADI